MSRPTRTVLGGVGVLALAFGVLSFFGSWEAQQSAGMWQAVVTSLAGSGVLLLVRRSGSGR